MTFDNRDLVLRGLLVVLPRHLESYVRALLTGGPAGPGPVRRRTGPAQQGAASRGHNPARGRLDLCPDIPDLADLSTQIRILTQRGDDGRYLLPLPPGLVGKLHEVRRFRNEAVHGRTFDTDHALAALVAVNETLRLIGAPEARAEVRPLIDALDTRRGADRDPLGAVSVQVRCPEVLGYADAVVGGTVSVALRLRTPESPGVEWDASHAVPGSEARPVGAVDVTVVIVEDGGGREITVPWTTTWEPSGTGVRELAVTAELEFDRAGLLQVEQTGPSHVRIELHGLRGTHSLSPVPGPTVLPPRHWRLHDNRASAGAALATFVQPGQESVEDLLAQAGARPKVSRSGPKARADAVAQAACGVLRRCGITIEAGEPWVRAQLVRTASRVLDERRAGPLDIAVLLAGLLERLGAAPVLLLNPDTVFLGYLRTPATVAPRTTAEVTALVEHGEMGLIDPLIAARSTGAVHPRPTDRVRDLVLPALAELSLVVPIIDARSAGVVPQPALARDLDDIVIEADPTPPRGPEAIASAGSGVSEDRRASRPVSPNRPAAAEEGSPHGPLTASALDDLRHEPAGAPRPAGEEADTSSLSHEPVRTVPGAVEAWKTSLLDLSLRNPLIDCTARHAVVLRVPPACVGMLEDIVNDRQLISLRPEEGAPLASDEPGGAESAARDLTEHRIVRVARTGQTSERTLEHMAADARIAVENTGANNLYLTVGTLVWRTNGRCLNSPLILIPVTLEPSGEHYSLRLDEMGASAPNHSLLRRFSADTGIVLAGLREPTPDEHGIDIEATIERIRDQLRNSGHDAVVEPSVHLGMFRFSTFRMWQDLEESWQTITSNPLVERLMGDQASEAGGAPPAPAEIPGRTPDRQDSPGQGTDLDALVESLPLPADATQAQVVADAVAGRTLVVEGPPGTGKSQTVANLIFRALATGSTVMFVAEKRSALDVVAHRLQDAGIGDLLLDLHDNGMRPAEVRDQLCPVVSTAGTPEVENPDGLRDELAALRERLEDYRRALHHPGPDGRSLYGARQALLAHQDERGPAQAQARSAWETAMRVGGLNEFDAADHEALLEGYRCAQERLRQALPVELRKTVQARRARVLHAAGPRAEELQHELRRRSRGLSVRELMGRYGDLITAYTPCLLVSPDSVARYFPPDRQYVDIVVFDEASQITVAGAVGPMGRGRSVVVIGDPKQMPPAAAPGTAAARGADIEAAGAGDQDSILDRCLEIGVRSRRLSWHYRSQSEALIAFSNAHYYEGALMSFPSPLTVSGPGQDGPGGHGICLRRVEGHYVGSEKRAKHPRLRSGTNPVEAHQVVKEVMRRFEASPQAAPSLGVITMNTRQRELIESLLRRDGGRRVREALEARDGLFVRNLENVQGEERDTILFSVVFSANERGDVPLNIGSLNRVGGERRLNVAITRARQQVVVFTSFDPEQLHAERSAHQGVKDLRAYIEHARKGRPPRARRNRWEEVDLHRNEIAERLRDAGMTVRIGVGHSSFAIDLVVALQGAAEHTGVAVLLDGPGWSRRPTATDRDLLPVDVLRTMGWRRVERIWMPEWIQQEQAVLDRIIRAVGGQPLPGGQAVASPNGSTVEEAATDGQKAASKGKTMPTVAVGGPEPDGEPGSEESAPATPLASAPGGAADQSTVPGAELRAGPVDYNPWMPGGVHPTDVLNRASTDEEARRQVIKVAREVCELESPIARRRLIVKVCRAFGVSRTTANRERAVREVLGEAFAYVDQHDFVWRSMDDRAVAPPYRRHALDHVDSIAEIHPEELTALMADVRAVSPEWCSAEELCERALRRLSAKKRKLSARGVRDALVAALERAESETP
ncbi:MAG: AAA domain-containing protein [Actinomyces sp.]|uniref:DUF3320 domain-containing protein n=1 Tax=Actinomyces sp. TaxID=29317 RepID=UPI0026DC2E54|nr:DUF3320 domain-containing protein [Actinomyces sp.]MDO4242887.1 AAA domain-containing protein [Actinomyces sp.]